MPKRQACKSEAGARGARSLELFVVQSVPAKDGAAVKAALPDHPGHQARREAEGTPTFPGPISDESEDEIRKGAAGYLLNARTPTGAPDDPVARFQLGNGAQIHARHPGAGPSENGMRQSSGARVNHQYGLDQPERNHEQSVRDGRVSTADSFRTAAQVRKGRTP